MDNSFTSPSTGTTEALVDTATAAAFLSLSIDQIRRMAASGQLPSRRYGLGKRKIYRFRLSELASEAFRPTA